jgi:cytochrome c oxidase assembly protein subunit 20
MADDSRELTKSTQSPDTTEQSSELPPKPKTKYELPKSQVGKLWEAFGNPEDQVNMLPTAHGKKANDISVTEAMKSLPLNSATSFYKAPCARDSLLLGIGAGFGVGGVRGVLGGKNITHVSTTKRKSWSDID